MTFCGYCDTSNVYEDTSAIAHCPACCEAAAEARRILRRHRWEKP